MKRSQKSVWLGLAVITVLSLIPLYHRPHDAKILLLTLPACAILWAEGGAVGWLAVLFTSGGIVATSDLPLLFLQMASTPPAPGLRGQVLFLITTRPAALMLFAESIFYLSVYVVHYLSVRHSDVRARPAGVMQSAG